MATEWQAPPGADVVLRASGGSEFHAHKLVLSMASSVFGDMFSVPQPPSTNPSQLPIVDVDDPPEALGMFLQFIYPVRNPPINDIETLASLLRLGDKYHATAVLDAHREYLPSMYIDSPPIHVYAVLCACGREREAEAAARRVSFASLATLSSPLLHLMSVQHYQRLMKFMVTRSTRMRHIVKGHQATITAAVGVWDDARRCYGCNDAAHKFYSSTITATLQAAFEENPCLRVVEASGLVTNAPLVFSPCGEHCRYNTKGLQGYAESLLKELVEMAQTLSWEGDTLPDQSTVPPRSRRRVVVVA